MRAADDKLAGRVHQQHEFVVEEGPHPLGQLGYHTGQQHRLHIVVDGLQHLAVGRVLCLLRAVDRRHELVVLGRDDDGVHAHRLVLLVILDGHLRLGVWTQIRRHPPLAQIGHGRSLATNGGQLDEQQVRQVEREGHVVVGLVAGVAKHHTLVAGTLLHGIGALHAPVDVGRLFVNGREDTARVGIELVRTLIISNPVDYPTGHLHQIDIGIRFNLARQNDLPGRHKGFASNFRVGVIGQKLVKQSVRNLIGHFIGVSFRHRFRGKQIVHFSLE